MPVQEREITIPRWKCGFDKFFLYIISWILYRHTGRRRQFHAGVQESLKLTTLKITKEIKYTKKNHFAINGLEMDQEGPTDVTAKENVVAVGGLFISHECGVASNMHAMFGNGAGSVNNLRHERHTSGLRVIVFSEIFFTKWPPPPLKTIL